MKIKIEVRDQAVRALLANLQQAGEALRPAFEAIGETMVESTRLRFAESRAPNGSSWQPLSLKTLIARSRRGQRGGNRLRGAIPAAQPLLDTGQLRNSITHRASDRDVIVGTRFDWAAVHQLGGHAGRGRRAFIPARPFLGISREDRVEVVDILRTHFAGVA